MSSIIYFFSAFFLTVFFTLVVKSLAQKLKIVDRPDGQRKKHRQPIPLLGGVAIFLSFWLMVIWLVYRGEVSALLSGQLVGVFLGSLVLMIVGYFDDKYDLSAGLRLGLSSSAVILAIIGGVGLTGITNPFGGILSLDIWQIDFFWGKLVVLADVLVFFWLMGMMYTVKILDGLDGLATGIIFIGAVMIFALSSFTIFKQPEIALISLVLAGACLGFLFFNFHPAKIFLGEGGGLFLGYILGVLAVISGGKIATALLVMGIPVFDMLRVIYLRFKNHQPIFKGDRRHLHFQLLDYGVSETSAVFLLYAIAMLFGLTTLFLTSFLKIIMLLLLGVAMIIAGMYFSKKTNQSYEKV